MRIRLLAALGGRAIGAVFEHDQQGAEALINAGFAEPADPADQGKTAPTVPQKGAQPAEKPSRRARPAPRG
ncbi:hypothetical protein [Lentzea sp. NBRC 102530]|uniref:hypothetical protein n=1 Tax=Lentzea sp. NBRC 102530 TaxID=3032201 RepID=UPI0024A2F043|nr:hypothetical protein [Lentzea sp. NBRC 102530]GLY51311.1 hypothetical protein Lesp01_49670 [Lentzea sp. NBRC 102530]